MKDLINMINQIHANHESFLESFPDDINTPEGRTYCINNILIETKSLLDSLSHLAIVEKTYTPEQIQDAFMIIMVNASEMMDKYNNRNIDWYNEAIMIMNKGMEEGDN